MSARCGGATACGREGVDDGNSRSEPTAPRRRGYCFRLADFILPARRFAEAFLAADLVRVRAAVFASV
jgi:hypothetical protein